MLKARAVNYHLNKLVLIFLSVEKGGGLDGKACMCDGLMLVGICGVLRI